MAKIGDRIRIIFMEGEPQYTGKEGIVEQFGKDPWGDDFMRGTWGGCSVYPKVDRFEVL